jgi:hypothetical protein
MASAISATAVADPGHHVSWSKIETGPWVLTPVYAEGAGGSELHSFLALADSGEVTGNNLIGVWYIRETGGWSSKSWTTSDPWKIISHVKEALAISSDEDDRWGAPTPPSGVAESEAPEDYSSGVLANDPLAAIIAGSPDRDLLVEFLVASGYPAASVPVDKSGDECTANETLDTLATLVGSDLAGSQEASTTFIVGTSPGCIPMGAMGPRVPQGPKPATWPYANPPGTVPGGAPPGPGWTPGAWGAYTCTGTPAAGGGTTCRCTSGRWWARWELRPCGIFGGVCQRWVEVREMDSCTNTITPAGPCPAPPAGYACTPVTTY